MSLTGDFATIKDWIKSIDNLKKATGKIAKAALPKLTEVVAAEFSAGAGPYGDAWTPKKDGGQPFAGSDAEGRVKVRLLNESTVRTTVNYPMHFHQDGTHGGGRKSQKAARAMFKELGGSRKVQKAAAESVRAKGMAGGWRDPPRPVIPVEESGVPDTWKAAINEAATEIMEGAGARRVG